MTRMFHTFCRDQRGAITGFSFFLAITMMLLGAIAVDVGFTYRQKAHLQNVADTTAHAAIMSRELAEADEAKSTAMALLQTVAPIEVYGPVATANDIEFGDWDAVEGKFYPDPYSNRAVRVITRHSESRRNATSALLMRIAGRELWDVSAVSVFETYRPTCFREGFVAEDVVDVQSNNVYTNGFCIHSNTYVKASSGNFFADSTIVSMPDRQDIQLPNSGFDSNDGLYEALRDGVYRMRILNRLPEIEAELHDPFSDYQPDYIHGPTVLSVSGKANKLEPADFTQGYVHEATCKNGSLTLEGGTYSDIVLLTGCAVKMSAGVILENVIVATTDTGDKSINAPSGLQIGRNDHCATDGGSQLLTFGGFDVASDLKVFGGQVLALGDIAFSANANGIEGASFVAMGTISGTSNMTMGFCGDGMERNFEADYFRLAQ